MFIKRFTSKYLKIQRKSGEVKSAATEHVILQLLFVSLGSHQPIVWFSKGHMLFNRKLILAPTTYPPVNQACKPKT